MKKTSAAIAAILLLGALSSAQGQYLEATIPVGDTPSRLFWNPQTNRVYCSNTQDGTVTVIDGATNAVRATINVADYPGKYALATRHNKVYCTSGESNRVNVICGSGDSVLRRVRMYDYPDEMAYSETRDLLYVNRWDGGLVDVLDASADTLVGRIAMSGEGRVPMQWSRISGRLFCLDENGRRLEVVDCDDNTVVMTWLLNEHPYSVVSNARDGEVYVACDNYLYSFTAQGDSHTARVETGVDFPETMVYYARRNLLYVMSINAAYVAVIECSTHTVADSLARVATYDAVCDTGRGKLYLIDRINNYLQVYRLSDGVLLRSIPLGRHPVRMAWNHVNSRVYVSDGMDDVVYVIRDTTAAVSEEAEVAVVRRTSSRIVRGVLKLGRQITAYGSRPELLDVTGRKMLDLKAGVNDVSRLVAGVYFVRRLGPAGPADLERVLLVR